MRSLLAGIGIGISLGILFAPKSGRETRNDIRGRTNDLADQAAGAIEEGRQKLNLKISAVKGGVEQLKDRASKAVADLSGERTGTQGV